MPKSKNTLKIFFASSGTLEPFRLEFEHIVNQVNKWHDKLHLETVKWETDIESGSYDGKNVQEEINPLLEACDIVFVAIHDKLGKFTLEEYQLARSLGKKVFVYFFQQEDGSNDAVSAFRQHLERENKSIDPYIEYMFEAFRSKALIDLQTYLVRQRVEQLPNGFEWVLPTEFDQAPKVLRYVYFLQPNILPYFSRDAFKASEKCPDTFWTETEILNELLDDRPNELVSNQGCIIYGEGGIGKTRLMLELGYRAIALNWSPIRVDKTVEDVEILAPYLKPGRKYVLLFDYIEESEGFKNDLPALLAEKTGALVRVVANCRYTHNIPDDITFLPVHLDKDDVVQKKYEDAVIQHIIQDVRMDLGEDQFQFHLIKPSFAVFLRFLWFNNKITKSDIREEGDFKTWIKRRMCLTMGIKDFDQMDEEVIYTLTLLPAPRAQIFTSGKRKKFLQKMITDGWLDWQKAKNSDEAQLEVIHDTIIDELLIIHLAGIRGDEAGEISDMWQNAIENQALPNCLRAFERIVGQIAGLGEDAFFRLFKKYLERSPESFSTIRQWVGVTSLLREFQRVQLFLQFSEFFQPYMVSGQFANSLCFAMNECVKGKTKEGLAVQLKQVFQIWYTANPNFYLLKTLDYKVISTYIKLFGLDEQATAWATKYIQRPQVFSTASFVIDAWLQKGGNRDEIEPFVRKYLRLYRYENETQFVIKSWLDSGGPKELVELAVGRYLSKNAGKREASYVIKSWLEASRSISVIESAVPEYLEQNAKEKEASYVIQLWLVSKGDRSAVKSGVKEYLEHHGKEKEARYVIQSWLAAGGKGPAVKSGVKQYLEHNCKEKEARYVIQSWLVAGGKESVVESGVKQYLEYHDEEEEARHLFQPWLAAGGNRSVIENGVKQYLDNYGKEKEASYVIQLWLDAEGEQSESDRSVVKSGVKQYLDEHGKEKEASFVIKSWLVAGGETPLIENALSAYLEQNAKEKEASFVIQSWLIAKGDSKIVEPGVRQYLEHNSKEKEASFVIQSWLDVVGEMPLVENALKAYLEVNAEHKHTRHLIKSWLQAGGDKELLQASLRRYLNTNAEEHTTHQVFKVWLDAGGDKELIRDEIFRHLNKNPGGKNARKLFRAWLVSGSEESDTSLLHKQYLDKNAELKECWGAIIVWLKSGNDPESIKSVVEKYLSCNASEGEARHVIGTWLESKGDKAVVEAALKIYFAHHAAENEARFVLTIWLDARHDKGVVKDYVKTYLTHNATEKEASFVFKSWLDAGGDKELVKSALLDYLQTNVKEEEVRFVLASWLLKEGDRDLIKDVLLQHLEVLSQHKDTTFVFNAWVKNGGPLSPIENHVRDYLSQNAGYYHAHVFYSEAMRREQYKQIVKFAVPVWLDNNMSKEESIHVLKNWLIAFNDEQHIAELLQRFMKVHSTRFITTYFYQEWLRLDKALETIQPFLMDWLTYNNKNMNPGYIYSLLLDRRELVPDFAPVFLDWYNLHEEDQIAIRLFGRYERALP